MWALHVIGGWTADALVQTLGDADEHIRAWAIQLLCEDKAPSDIALEKFARMARSERSAVVRLYLASALQRLDPRLRWPIASELMAHAEDTGDQNLPKMIWLGIEPLVPTDPALALDHASRSRIPVLTRFIARRAVDADAIDAVVAALEKFLESALASPKRNAEVGEMLDGMKDALEGRYDVVAPPQWSGVYSRLQRGSVAVSRIATEINRQFNDADSTAANLQAIRSSTLDDRRRAVQTLTLQRRPQLVPLLPALLDDQSLRVDAIKSIATFDDDSLGKLLVSRYATFNEAEKLEVIQTLASRPRYARMLTDALADNVIPKRAVPPHIARQLRRLVGARFADVWGPVDQNAAEDRAYARYRGVLNDTAMKSANAQNGHGIFLRTCGPCHTMYGEGGNIGPDLTGSNRANLEYLLSNVLNPNGDVPDAYKMVVITTRDGRTFSGNVISETDQQLTLRVVGRDNAVIRKSDIQSREMTSTSMMPTGLFDSLTDREVIDLVSYLRSVVKVP
jgi:putative heme-binding domain-containing protein